MQKRKKRAGGLSDVAAGVITLVVVAVGVYWGFARPDPFAKPYHLTAIFANADGLKAGSPVREAGVDVGKVTKVESIEDGRPMARVDIELADKGLPVHEDARLFLRARIFLEGNLFVDLKPGSPSAPELPDRGVIGPAQTASTVHFGDLLSALQTDTRSDLQTFLEEYARGTAAGGARGFNDSIPWWEPAYRYSSIASDATQGSEPNDLSDLLRGQQRVARALTRNEAALKDLIVKFDVTAGALAAQSRPLAATVPALDDVLRVGPPALASLNSALPAVRRFAVDALPGVRSSDEALAASTPLLAQARLLMRPSELQGLANDLRTAIPDLASLQQSAVGFFTQTRALSACTANVLVPFAHTPIPDPDFPASNNEKVYRENVRAFVGLNGESRTQDAISPFHRVQGDAGPATVAFESQAGERYFARSLFPVLGTRPAQSPRPPSRPGAPCETQETPDLNAPAGPADQLVNPRPADNAAARALRKLSGHELGRVTAHLQFQHDGVGSVDPLSFSDRGERMHANTLGYVKDPVTDLYVDPHGLARLRRSRK